MKSLRWRIVSVVLLTVTCVFFLIPRNRTQRQYDAASGTMVDRTVRQVPINLGLDLRGGVHMALEVDPSKSRVADCADAIKRAEHVVRKRMDEFGTAERVVQLAGDCRLIVELPGVSDPARAREIVQRTAFLEMRFTDARDQLKDALPAIDAALRRAGVSGPRREPSQVMTELFQQGRADSAASQTGGLSGLLSRGTVPGEYLVASEDQELVEQWLALPEVQRQLPRNVVLRWGAQEAGSGASGYRALYVLEGRTVLTGEDLQNAVAGRDPQTNGAEVRFELTRAAGRRFGAATERNIGNYMAIVLDGRVQGGPPVIEERIEASGRIKMEGRTLQDANDLALVLRAGALPVPLQIVEERTIGPSLGSDSIEAGVRASVFALLLVLFVLAVYYKLGGLFAVGALFLYILFSLGALAARGFTLTMPGLAGFALSIGMAVDANVLIFERIREELAARKPLSQAVEAGFRNAMSAIVDSNVTTAFTALILYFVGTTPVRGFAVTLLIGLCASMVTAVFVTRTFFLIWLGRRKRSVTLTFRSFRFFENARFDFIRRRRWAYGLSTLLILPGLVLLAVRGVNYSIEFTGGALVHVQTSAASSTGALQSALQTGGINGAEVQSFGSNRDFVIRARLNQQQSSEAETDAIARGVRNALDQGLGKQSYSIMSSERVGPKVGAELQQKALIAILLSFVSTLIYLAFRFEWRFGLAAVLASAHDVLATIAFIGYLDLEVSMPVVAGVLTVLGYSLNDTIVIFDRVRENLRARIKRSFIEVLNVSINETLPRTVLTGGTTLGTALVLSFFAGAVIKPFALVMSFGIVVGTFSSIFVAAPILLAIGQRAGRPQATPPAVAVPEPSAV